MSSRNKWPPRVIEFAKALYGYPFHCVTCDRVGAELHHLDENNENMGRFNAVPLCSEANKHIEYDRIHSRDLTPELHIAALIATANEAELLGRYKRSYGCFRVGAFVYSPSRKTLALTNISLQMAVGAIRAARIIGRLDLVSDTILRNIIPLFNYSQLLKQYFLTTASQEIALTFRNVGDLQRFSLWESVSKHIVQESQIESFDRNALLARTNNHLVVGQIAHLEQKHNIEISSYLSFDLETPSIFSQAEFNVWYSRALITDGNIEQAQSALSELENIYKKPDLVPNDGFPGEDDLGMVGCSPYAGMHIMETKTQLLRIIAPNHPDTIDYCRRVFNTIVKTGAIEEYPLRTTLIDFMRSHDEQAYNHIVYSRNIYTYSYIPHLIKAADEYLLHLSNTMQYLQPLCEKSKRL